MKKQEHISMDAQKESSSQRGTSKPQPSQQQPPPKRTTPKPNTEKLDPGDMSMASSDPEDGGESA
jgi:hypothetical protein